MAVAQSRDEVDSPPPPVDPHAAAVARKKRMQQRRKLRAEDEDDSSRGSGPKRPRLSEDGDDDDSVVVVDEVQSLAGEKPKPHPTGIKKQSRYHPGVPMTREELREWRKEARRVRNRESAAASRKKNRSRIEELEAEVEGMKTKYSAALQRILELEASSSSAPHASAFTPEILRQDLLDQLSKQPQRTASPPPNSVVGALKTVSPPNSPSLSHLVPESDLQTQVDHKYQHIMEMIQRPIA